MINCFKRGIVIILIGTFFFTGCQSINKKSATTEEIPKPVENPAAEIVSEAILPAQQPKPLEAQDIVPSAATGSNAGAHGQNMFHDFTLQGTKKETIILSSYIGKHPVMLFFWATWCPFCRKELKVLKEKYPQLVKDGMEVMVINIGEPGYKVDNFAQAQKIDFRMLLDTDSSVSEKYEIYGIPTFILLDKSGKIVFSDNYFPEKECKELALKK